MFRWSAYLNGSNRARTLSDQSMVNTAPAFSSASDSAMAQNDARLRLPRVRKELREVEIVREEHELMRSHGISSNARSWLGRRDSNPDTQIQSLQSYR